MTESETGDDVASENRTSRRNAMRVMMGAGATSILSIASGCDEAAEKLKPVGQTVVYKTPQGDLRDGELSASLPSNGGSSKIERELDPEQSVTSVGETNGHVSLSPDATEVAYIEVGGDPYYEFVIRSLSGGDARFTPSDLEQYSNTVTNTFELGFYHALDWCPASGSDKLALAMRGGSEIAEWHLAKFDHGSKTASLFKTGTRPSLSAPGVAWSPSCNEVVVNQRASGGTSSPLRVLNASSGDDVRQISNARDPSWGDTGIAFVRNGNVYLNRQSGTVQVTSSSATDSHPVIFDQDEGESLAFLRNGRIYLVKRIDEYGNNPNPSPVKVATDEKVETFDVVK